MTYSHKNTNQQAINLPVGKVVCVGRNYAEHAKELNNPVPTTPLLFMKPASSLVSLSNNGTINFPKDKGDCHFETEIAILIQQDITLDTPEGKIHEAIWGYALALDLTLRELQSTLKAKGHPWEKAKCFDGACPITHFLPASALPKAPEDIKYKLHYNGSIEQVGNTQNMITSIVPLLHYMAEFFTLNAGDVILTGTPAGVGKLTVGDSLKLSLEKVLSVSATVI